MLGGREKAIFPRARLEDDGRAGRLGDDLSERLAALLDGNLRRALNHLSDRILRGSDDRIAAIRRRIGVHVDATVVIEQMPPCFARTHILLAFGQGILLTLRTDQRHLEIGRLTQENVDVGAVGDAVLIGREHARRDAEFRQQRQRRVAVRDGQRAGVRVGRAGLVNRGECPRINAIRDQAADDLLTVEILAGQREPVDDAAEGDAVIVGDAGFVVAEAVDRAVGAR